MPYSTPIDRGGYPAPVIRARPGSMHPGLHPPTVRPLPKQAWGSLTTVAEMEHYLPIPQTMKELARPTLDHQHYHRQPGPMLHPDTPGHLRDNDGNLLTAHPISMGHTQAGIDLTQTSHGIVAYGSDPHQKGLDHVGFSSVNLL